MWRVLWLALWLATAKAQLWHTYSQFEGDTRCLLATNGTDTCVRECVNLYTGAVSNVSASCDGTPDPTHECQGPQLLTLAHQLQLALANNSRAAVFDIVNSQRWRHCDAEFRRRADFGAEVVVTLPTRADTCTARPRRMVRYALGAVNNTGCENLELQPHAHPQVVLLRRETENADLNLSACGRHVNGTWPCRVDDDCFTHCQSGFCAAPFARPDAVWVACMLRVLPNRDALAARWNVQRHNVSDWVRELRARVGVERCTDAGFTTRETCEALNRSQPALCGECDGPFCRDTRANATCVQSRTASDCTAQGGVFDTHCTLPWNGTQCLVHCEAAPRCVVPCPAGKRVTYALPHRTVSWCENATCETPSLPPLNLSVASELQLLQRINCARAVCIDPTRTALNCSGANVTSAVHASMLGTLPQDLRVLAATEAWVRTATELQLWVSVTTGSPTVAFTGAMAINFTYHGVPLAPQLVTGVETCGLGCQYDFVAHFPGLCSERSTSVGYRWALDTMSGQRQGSLWMEVCWDQSVFRNNRCERRDPAGCTATYVPAVVAWEPERGCVQGERVSACDRPCRACLGTGVCVHTNATRCQSVGTWNGSACRLVDTEAECTDTWEGGCTWADAPCANQTECEAQSACSDGECRTTETCLGAVGNQTECTRCGGTWAAVARTTTGVWSEREPVAMRTREAGVYAANAWLTYIDLEAAEALLREPAEDPDRMRAYFTPWANALSYVACQCGPLCSLPRPVVDTRLPCGYNNSVLAGLFQWFGRCEGEGHVALSLTVVPFAERVLGTGRRLLSLPNNSCVLTEPNATGEPVGQIRGDCVELTLDGAATGSLCLPIDSTRAWNTYLATGAISRNGVVEQLGTFMDDLQICGPVNGSGTYCPVAVYGLEAPSVDLCDLATTELEHERCMSSNGRWVAFGAYVAMAVFWLAAIFYSAHRGHKRAAELRLVSVFASLAALITEVASATLSLGYMLTGLMLRAMAAVFAMAGTTPGNDRVARGVALLGTSGLLFLTLGFTAELHSAHPATYAFLAAAGLVGAVHVPTASPTKKPRSILRMWVDLRPAAVGALLLTATAFGLFLWSQTQTYCW